MELEVRVVNIRDVRTHEKADRLDIATIAGYECVVQRGLHRTGDAAVYIPEASVLPQDLLQDLDLWDHQESKGKLAGRDGDRVSAIRLKGSGLPGTARTGAARDETRGRRSPVLQHHQVGAPRSPTT